MTTYSSFNLGSAPGKRPTTFGASTDSRLTVALARSTPVRGNLGSGLFSRTSSSISSRVWPLPARKRSAPWRVIASAICWPASPGGRVRRGRNEAARGRGRRVRPRRPVAPDRPEHSVGDWGGWRLPIAPARLRAAHRSAPDPKCEITLPGASDRSAEHSRRRRFSPSGRGRRARRSRLRGWPCHSRRRPWAPRLGRRCRRGSRGWRPGR